MFQYWLKQPAQVAALEILDARDRVIRRYPDTANAAGGRGGRGGAGAGFGRRRWAAAVGAAAVAIRERRSDAHGRDSTRSRGTVGIAPATTFPGMILWGGSTNGPQARAGTLLRYVSSADREDDDAADSS